jgi:hypothetical protein
MTKSTWCNRFQTLKWRFLIRFLWRRTWVLWPAKRFHDTKRFMIIRGGPHIVEKVVLATGGSASTIQIHKKPTMSTTNFRWRTTTTSYCYFYPATTTIQKPPTKLLLIIPADRGIYFDKKTDDNIKADWIEGEYFKRLLEKNHDCSLLHGKKKLARPLDLARNNEREKERERERERERN